MEVSWGVWSRGDSSGQSYDPPDWLYAGSTNGEEEPLRYPSREEAEARASALRSAQPSCVYEARLYVPLLEAILKRFEWMEAMGFIVNHVYLSPFEAALLKALPEDGAFTPAAKLAIPQPGLVGLFHGAMVFENHHIPNGHVALIPGDMAVEILGPACSMPIGEYT